MNEIKIIICDLDGTLLNEEEMMSELTINYICLFDYLFISSQMSAKPYFMGSTGILHLR